MLVPSRTQHAPDEGIAHARGRRARLPPIDPARLIAVDDVEQALQAVIAAGGGAVGNIATTKVDGVGVLCVVYARDPEGNIVELQKWS